MCISLTANMNFQWTIAVYCAAFIAVVASRTVLVQNEGVLSDNSVYGYLTNVGLPLANKIREAEEQDFRTKSPVGNDKPSTMIFQGSGARLGEIPYQAGLLASFQQGQSVCGGSLINARRVITAAHCWWDGESKAWSFEVVLGSVYLYHGGVRLISKDVSMHSHWNPKQLSNDIAMINLPTAVQFSNAISPISLPSGQDLHQNFVGQKVMASGFGKTSDGAKISRGTFLNHVKLDVIANSQCHRFYQILQPTNICTHDMRGKNVCGGDSGGPLVAFSNNKRILIGVVSFGSLSCQIGRPAVYTRVTSYIDWINQRL